MYFFFVSPPKNMYSVSKNTRICSSRALKGADIAAGGTRYGQKKRFHTPDVFSQKSNQIDNSWRIRWFYFRWFVLNKSLPTRVTSRKKTMTLARAHIGGNFNLSIFYEIDCVHNNRAPVTNACLPQHRGKRIVSYAEMLIFVLTGPDRNR